MDGEGSLGCRKEMVDLDSKNENVGGKTNSKIIRGFFSFVSGDSVATYISSLHGQLVAWS